MSGDMAASMRIPDVCTVVVFTSVIFSCVWALLERQDLKGNRQQPFKEDTDTETFSPSAPVLSQMDYEILGTSGFSITDVTQNSNLSEVSKLQRSDLANKKQMETSLDKPMMKRGTYLPRYSTTVPVEQRPDTQPTSASNGLEPTTESSTEALDLTRAETEIITEASILKSSDSSSTTTHRWNLSVNDTPIYLSSTQKTLDSADTTNGDIYIYPTEMNETNSLRVTQRKFNQISNQINSTVHLTFTNESSSIKQIGPADIHNGESTTLHTITDNTEESIINLTLPSKSDEATLKHLQEEIFSTTSAIRLKKAFTTQPYSSFNSTLLSSNNTQSEAWTVANISVLTNESTENVSILNVFSTEQPSLQLTSQDARLRPLITKVDHTTVEEKTESVSSSSSSTEWAQVTPGALPNLVTTDVKSSLATPVFTQMPQLLVNVSGQIRIIRGMIWMYQLNDKMSAEFQYYSRKVQRMLEEMFWRTWLAKHIKKIDVHRFRRGSVMVDFRLVVKTERHIRPQEMELLFNSFLLPDGGFGGFQMDRHFTKFQIFEPVVTVASQIPVENNNLPQWATALIVISGASLVFVVLFGIVTVYGTFPFLSAKNHQRLKEEESARSCKPPKVECTEWERKAVAAYENLSADGIYDLDETVDGGYRRKLESTEA